MTVLQLGIIATANYAFLNYFILIFGVLLLDDAAVAWVRGVIHLPVTGPDMAEEVTASVSEGRRRWARWTEAVVLVWALCATVVAFPGGAFRFLPAFPERALEPFRFANGYGLFATMTPARYEIEFQGSNDGGKTWIAYPFRYKPQDPFERPGIYAPYQPRFEWNLWFASLDQWRASPWVVVAQERLIEGSPSVLALFRGDPFKGAPPPRVRTVLWQYWFTDPATRRATGAWWRRKELGPFAGTLTRQPDGRFVLSESR